MLVTSMHRNYVVAYDYIEYGAGYTNPGSPIAPQQKPTIAVFAAV